MAWNLLRFVVVDCLTVHGSQGTPNAHYRRISRLCRHREARGTGKPQHRLVSGKNNARCLAYARGLRMLQLPAAPVIRNFRPVCDCVVMRSSWPPELNSPP